MAELIKQCWFLLAKMGSRELEKEKQMLHIPIHEF